MEICKRLLTLAGEKGCLRAVGLSYRDAGVDIEAADRLVERIRELSQKSQGPSVLGGIGGFASLFSLKALIEAGGGMADPLLVSGTDGVGTKLMVAFQHGVHDKVGIDLVAMCVNDILTTGADPLFFLDYFATGHLDVEVGAQVIQGVATGCEEAGCALVGGETAELPGLYQPGEYDLAGFAVGLVDRPKLIDGSNAEAGDQLLALPSSGLHSNGYSLARKTLLEHAKLPLSEPLPGDSLPLGDRLLTPTLIYAKVLKAIRARTQPSAIAHITGGGIPGNLPRVLPETLTAHLFEGSWPVPPIFEAIQKAGEVAPDEMQKTFNLGVGMILALPPRQVEVAIAVARSHGHAATLIGELRSRKPGDPALVVHPQKA